MLVDLCTKAGVTGKGSALASLTDEEVARGQGVYRRRPSRRGAAAAPAAAAGGRGRAGVAAVAACPGRAEPAVVPARRLHRPAAARRERRPSRMHAGEAAVDRPTGHDAAEAGRSPRDRPRSCAADQAGADARGSAADGRGQAGRAGRRRSPTSSSRPTPSAPRPASKPLSEHLRKHEQKQASPKEPAQTPRRRPRRGPRRRRTRRRPRGRRRGQTRKKAAAGQRRPAAARGDEEEGTATLGGREQRQLKRKRTATDRGTAAAGDEEDDRRPRAVAARSARTARRAPTPPPRARARSSCSSPARSAVSPKPSAFPPRKCWASCMALGTMANINAESRSGNGRVAGRRTGGRDRSSAKPVDLEEKCCSESPSARTIPATLQPRPPVVTFLGHVDHGKTSLLDRIIGIDVASAERAASRSTSAPTESRRTAGRSPSSTRRATRPSPRCGPAAPTCTDIAVLVVAADDGVMPQTEEAISHARAAGVPIVVALNKIDLPGVNIDRIYAAIGGQRPVAQPNGAATPKWCKTSAVTGDGHRRAAGNAADRGRAARVQGQSRPAGRGHLPGGRGARGPRRGGQGAGAEGHAAGRRRDRLRLGLRPRQGDVRHAQAATRRYKRGRALDAGQLTGLDVAAGAGDRFYVLDDISRGPADRRRAGRRPRSSGAGRQPAARHAGEPASSGSARRAKCRR